MWSGSQGKKKNSSSSKKKKLNSFGHGNTLLSSQHLEAEAGGLHAGDQPGIHSETLS